MITLFTTAKPFRGHIGIIQRNAIRSWTLLRPACEIILFGDDEGTAETAVEFGVRQVPDVAQNEYGTPLLDDLFGKASCLAAHALLCYVNADIVLMSDFIQAVERIAHREGAFLMVGQRWDVDLARPWDFGRPDWETRMREHVRNRGRLHRPTGIDYFVFRRGLWGEIPPFAIGRSSWDNWLLYQARSRRALSIDATHFVTAVHQNHGLPSCAHRESDTRQIREFERNRELTGGRDHVFTLEDATHVLTSAGVKRVLTLTRLVRHLETLPVVSPHLGPLLWPSKMWLLGQRLARAVAWRVRRLLRGTRS